MIQIIKTNYQAGSFLKRTTCIGAFWLALQSSAVLAQDDVTYRVHWPVVPPEANVDGQYYRVNDMSFRTNLAGQANQVLFVGSYRRSDRAGTYYGFVYDHFGSIDPNQPEKFWDIEELVGPVPPDWAGSEYETVFYAMNDSGRATGMISGTNGVSWLPFYVDLFDPVPQLKPIPVPGNAAGSTKPYAVNQFGEILVGYSTSAGQWCSIYVPETGDEIGIPVSLRPVSNTSFNSLRQILGERQDGTVVRYTVTSDEGDGIVDEFPGVEILFDYGGHINEAGEFAGVIENSIGRGNRTAQFVARFGGPPGSGALAWEYDAREIWNEWAIAGQMNGDGDLLIFSSVNFDPPFLSRNDNPDQMLNLNDLITHESDPDFIFRGAPVDANAHDNRCLSNRDHSGFGWLAGSIDINPEQGAMDRRLYMLIPQGPGPTISVSPTSGVSTTEAGGTDSFDVVLDSEPAADVSIGISSSNTAEGTVDQASLTFTPANWDIPQTVTITGVDDNMEDGDVEYEIYVFPAESSDPDYDGLDPADVSVTNLDDEQPLVATYPSTDTPLAIPDNNAAGISSLIEDVGDHGGAAITVTLDIDHPRPEDLQAWVTPPDGGGSIPVIVSGDTDISGLVGDTQGTWNLTIRDTRNKKEGTLLSWSLTFE